MPRAQKKKKTAYMMLTKPYRVRIPYVDGTRFSHMPDLWNSTVGATYG